MQGRKPSAHLEECELLGKRPHHKMCWANEQEWALGGHRVEQKWLAQHGGQAHGVNSGDTVERWTCAFPLFPFKGGLYFSLWWQALSYVMYFTLYMDHIQRYTSYISIKHLLICLLSSNKSHPIFLLCLGLPWLSSYFVTREIEQKTSYCLYIPNSSLS